MTAATTLYLHGLPGSFGAEMAIAFGPGQWPSGVSGLDRLSALGEGRAYDAAVLGAFDMVAKARRDPGPIRLVAFSLGALPALTIAAARPDCLASLDLIAPAAPLQLGDFLPAMAGRPVFAAAQQGRFKLDLLTRMQAAGLTLAPGLIARQVLARAPDSERSLMGTPARRKAFVDGMKHALHVHAEAYRTELQAYVSDWTGTLPQVTTPARIWQGSDDTWVPPAMARALSASLGRPADLVALEGLSHFGALIHSLPKILVETAGPD